MIEHHDLGKIFVLNPMHDQRVSLVELRSDELIFHISELKLFVPYSEKARIYYEAHRSFKSCEIIFKGVEPADLLVEVKTRTGCTFKGKSYYDQEFVDFLRSHKYTIEMVNMYCGYMSIVVDAWLVDEKGNYCDESCVITITAKEIVYLWS